MNLYELRDELAKKHADKKVVMRFNESCKKGYDIVMIDGKPAMSGHAVYNQVVVEVEGMQPEIVAIKNHRQAIKFYELKSEVGKFSEAAVPDSIIASIVTMDNEDQDPALEQLSKDSLVPKATLALRLDTAKLLEKNKIEIPIIME